MGILDRWVTKQAGRQAEDSIYHPSHYTQGAVECIDAMRSCMEPAEFQGYLRGAAMKYLWRFRVKENPLRDLQKARWYLDQLIGELEKSELRPPLQR